MEIKDLSVDVERLEEVRGGLYRSPFGNTAINDSSNGFVASAVLVSAGHTNGSTFDVTNTVGQANTTTQGALATSERSHVRDTLLVNSQLSRGFGRFFD